MSLCLSLCFRLFHDPFHLLLRDDLIVRPEAKCLVQRVREVCSGVAGNITRALDVLEIHPPHLGYRIFTGEAMTKALFQHPV